MSDVQGLFELNERIKQGCPDCPWVHCKSQTVPSEGPLDAEVMVIGRNPGETEDREGIPFIGKGGRANDRFLSACGLKRARCYITNLAKCFGGLGDPAPTQALYDICKHWVLEEIRLLKPKAIIAYGNDVMKNILGFEGSTLSIQGQMFPTRFDNTKAFVCSHPGYWVRKPNYEEGVMIAVIAPKIRQGLISLGVEVEA
jgi:uracil-DNA glycosylase